MSAVASRAVAVGFEAIFAALSSTPISKTPGAAPASATQAALFPELLGQMVRSETGNRFFAALSATPGSKVTAPLSTRGSRKAEVARNRTAAEIIISDAGRNLMAPDPASARTQYPPAATLPMTAVSGSPSSETSDTGSDARDSAQAGADVAAAGAVPDTIRGAGTRAARRGPAAAVSASGIAAAGPTVGAIAPLAVGRFAAGRKSAVPAQNTQSEAQPPERPAADSASAVPEVGIHGSEAAGPAPRRFAAIAAGGGGHTSETDRAGGDRRDAMDADVVVPPAVDSPAEQKATPPQTRLVAAPPPDRPLADRGQQKVGDGYGGPHPTVGAGGDLSGGRSDFQSVPDPAPGLAVAVPPGKGARESEAAPVSSSAGAGAAAAPETAPQSRGVLPAPAAISPADTVGSEGVSTATSLLARLVARSGGQTSETDRVEGSQRDTVSADVAVPPAADGLAETETTAFQVLLVPAPASDQPPAGQGQQGVGDACDDQLPAVRDKGGESGGRPGFPSVRDREPRFALAVPPGGTGGQSQAEPAVRNLFSVAPVSSNQAAGAAAARETARPGGAAPLVPANSFRADAADPASAPKPEAGGAAREIHLDLRDADARVNLRLVERAGSVRIDVRTPDGHLAGSLRDDLPALSARLEQTGLRAETWHDAPAAAAARIRMAEPGTSGGFQLSQNQSRREGGGHNPRDGQPQEKRQQQHQPESQTQPKEFSWLYTSLQ